MTKFVSDDQLSEWFGYHPPATPEIARAHEAVRGACHQLAATFNSLLPECPDKTVALRAVREAMYAANATIACQQRLHVDAPRFPEVAEPSPPTQQPTIGSIVYCLGPQSNGTNYAPAIITRVWSEHPEGGWTVNVTAFPDAAAPESRTSVRLVDTEKQAHGLFNSAYWPSRT